MKALKESKENGTQKVDLSGKKAQLSELWKEKKRVGLTDTKLSSMEQMLLNEALKKNTTITELDFSSEKKEENDITFF